MGHGLRSWQYILLVALLEVIRERIDQGVLFVATHDDTCWFVDDSDIVIFIQYLELHLDDGCPVCFFLFVQLYDLSTRDVSTCKGDISIDLDEAFFDGFFHPFLCRNGLKDASHIIRESDRLREFWRKMFFELYQNIELWHKDNQNMSKSCV